MVASKGLFSKAKDKAAITNLEGHFNLIAYELIRPAEDGSMHLRVVLDEVEPGGGIEPHYHDLTPACDHAYYVISGEILASLAGREEIVGPDTLIYCPTDVVHSLRNVGNSPAKLLRIGAAASGDTGGKSVFVKENQ
ncbi:MAG: cupin domain-containing protein [Dehalococcoidales bacterium]|nr:cupin domain-containing protein [Dehalococcoidales bacterium]